MHVHANILVKFVLDKKILSHPDISNRFAGRLVDRSRFLDDIWGGWVGTQSEFAEFLDSVNDVGVHFGLTFTGQCGKKV